MINDARKSISQSSSSAVEQSLDKRYVSGSNPDWTICEYGVNG